MRKIANFFSRTQWKRRFRGLIAIAALLPLLSAMLPSAALAAEDEAKFDRMSVLVQPEYDDPRVLAVFEAQLSEDTKLPRKAEFYVPKNSAPHISIGMACEVPEGQGHRCKVYETTEEGDFNKLTYSVDAARNLFLEYYWDPFKDAKNAEAAKKGEKKFVYEFKAPVPIKQLDIQVQKPTKAKDFKIEPASTNASKDEEGFEYSTYSFKDVAKGQQFTFNADYINTEGQSKVKQIGGGAPPPGPANTANPGTTRVMLFFFILLFVAGGLAIYWRSQMAAPAPGGGAKQKAGKPKSGAKAKSKGATGAKYCSNCGGELSSGSKFCSECGEGVG